MKAIEVLLIEDNPIDVSLIRSILTGCSVPINLTTAADGAEALRVLAHTSYNPALVIVDLNLPKVDGQAVMEQLQGKGIGPFVVFTSSENPKDIDRAYQAGASAFFTKPIEYQPFINVVEKIAQDWIEPAARS